MLAGQAVRATAWPVTRPVTNYSLPAAMTVTLFRPGIRTVRVRVPFVSTGHADVDTALAAFVLTGRRPALDRSETRIKEGTMKLKFITGVALAFCFLPTTVCAQDTVTVKGIIKSRSGETMVVQTDSGDNTVVIAEDTNTKDDSGFFGLDKEMGPTVLIPGLKVKVDAVPDQQNRLVARTITVDGDDLEASEMIQAGLHPTAEQVAANLQRLQEHQSQLQSHQQKIESDRQDIETNRAGIAANKEKVDASIKEIEEHERRFASLDDFDVKNQATVKFGVGSTTISNADKAQLKQLAQAATNMSGFLIEVIGFADATGNAAMNTELSENRAKAVVSYLTQQCGVPSRRLVAPGAMGEYGPAASNESRAGRAENRRVEVKVLVNKGISQ